MDEIQVKELKKDMFYQAGIFLTENGLLAPFGSKIKSGIITPVGYFNDEENTVDTKKAISVIHDIFSQNIKDLSADAAAIAYDVAITINSDEGESLKRDAMCLLLTTDGDTWSEDYYLYALVDGKCVWD